MAPFHANPSDLSDAVAYELDAIEYLRAALHAQGETVSGGTTVTLGDLTPDGAFRRDLRMSARMAISDGAVRAALGRLRPLAFSAAFKIHDMIVEWILRANGVNAWAFREKLQAYDRLQAANSLAEPGLLAGHSVLSRAFWELYRFLVPFRGTVVHSGGVVLERDGTISITKSARTVKFTPDDQASYMRGMCLISKILSQQSNRDPFLENLIEGDLRGLDKYHAQHGLTVRHARLEALTVNVPVTHLLSAEPLAVRLDFDELRGMMEATHPPGPNGHLFFSVTIIAQVEQQQFEWHLPVEAVPTGTATLQRGDLACDRFLRVTAAVTKT